MKRDETEDNVAAAERESDMVESGGETTAAATGPAEIGAATPDTTGESENRARPVGADTMVKVAGETVSTEER
jgi:hypothetical protein